MSEVVEKPFVIKLELTRENMPTALKQFLSEFKPTDGWTRGNCQASIDIWVNAKIRDGISYTCSECNKPLGAIG